MSSLSHAERIPAGYALLLVLVLAFPSAKGFAPPISSKATTVTSSSTSLKSGKGFGKSSSKGTGGKGGFGEKTYGENIGSINDVIDAEAAMSEFFSSNEEWHPLFQRFVTHATTVTANSNVPATDFLNAPSSVDFNFDSPQAPWKRLDGIPTDESDRQVLAGVLDTMQAGLIDIPVDESTKDDENDLQFVEEGRRILAISRFHVLQGVSGGSVDCYDALFSTCWSELMELHVGNEEGTGSLIVVPDYELSDLRRFVDVNLLRPLTWLGMQADYEVTSLKFGSPAIRLLHKLQDMPMEPWNDPDAA